MLNLKCHRPNLTMTLEFDPCALDEVDVIEEFERDTGAGLPNAAADVFNVVTAAAVHPAATVSVATLFVDGRQTMLRHLSSNGAEVARLIGHCHWPRWGHPTLDRPRYAEEAYAGSSLLGAATTPEHAAKVALRELGQPQADVGPVAASLLGRLRLRDQTDVRRRRRAVHGPVTAPHPQGDSHGRAAPGHRRALPRARRHAG
jgi:hypothetical protein